VVDDQSYHPSLEIRVQSSLTESSRQSNHPHEQSRSEDDARNLRLRRAGKRTSTVKDSGVLPPPPSPSVLFPAPLADIVQRQLPAALTASKSHNQASGTSDQTLPLQWENMDWSAFAMPDLPASAAIPSDMSDIHFNQEEQDYL
jgi:hypothetical protein